MMQHDDDQLVAWLHDEPHAGSAGALERALNITRHVRQRPAWLVAAAGGTIRSRAAGPSVLRVALVIGAVAVVTAVLVGGLVVAGILRLPPAPSPPVIDSPGPSSSPAAPSSPPSSLPLVFYDEPGGVWVANVDGSGAHDLIPGGDLIQLSADGGLLGFAVNEADPGSEPEVTISVAEVIGPEPRLTNIRKVNITSGFAFSPDSTKLAFVRRLPEGDLAFGSSSVIAIMDLAAGDVVELQSTRTTALTSPPFPLAAVQWPDGYNSSPQWSPDGSQIVFGRELIGVPSPEHRLYDRTLYVVNADGSNLRQLVPTELFAGGGSWSPDGSRILFTSAVEWLGLDENTGQRDVAMQASDVYSVRPDGTDLRRITHDTVPGVDDGVPDPPGATAVSWTREGRIIFTRVPLVAADALAPFAELWVMDADGGNQQQLDRTDLGELNAAGCVACPYPPNTAGYWIQDPLAFWQPAP